MDPVDYLKKFVGEQPFPSDGLGKRPQSAGERIQNFPLGVKALLRDCLQYQGTQPGNVQLDRRQYIQQHQLQKDFRKMFPLVVLSIPPIIGSFPTILAVVAPRQFMSRHFHNPHELEAFAQIEYNQRIEAYPGLVDFLCGPIQHGTEAQEAIAHSLFSDSSAEDDVNPILGALELYKTVFAGEAAHESTIVTLSRDYLVSDCRASDDMCRFVTLKGTN